MKGVILILILCCSWPVAGQNNADTSGSALPVRITWSWAAVQMIPSPEWYVNKNKTSDFGIRWQVTPVLYSFGLNPHVSPWRILVAEPLARYNGSAEIYVSPEYIPDMKGDWLVRTGIRTYFPMHQYGEYLAGSLGVSYYRNFLENGLTYEAGLYIFFGILGLQVSHSPTSQRSNWIFTINIRYF